jgi:hypothetical protein
MVCQAHFTTPAPLLLCDVQSPVKFPRLRPWRIVSFPAACRRRLHREFPSSNASESPSSFPAPSPSPSPSRIPSFGPSGFPSRDPRHPPAGSQSAAPCSTHYCILHWINLPGLHLFLRLPLASLRPSKHPHIHRLCPRAVCCQRATL